MKILVTGGAGYLGSMLTQLLLQRAQDRVCVVDNFMYGQSSLAHLCRNPNLEIVRGDTRDGRIMEPLVSGADVIIPLAAIVGEPACNADQTAAYGTNQMAIENICRVASTSQAIIIPTTNSGYGIGEKGVMCTEQSPLKPISTYGKTKVAAESFVIQRGNGVSLRFATLFGMSPRMRLDLLVNDFVYRALRDRSVTLFEAHFTRNYLHVVDAARAFEHVIDNWGRMRDNIYNVGLSDANLSKAELCARIKRVIPAFTFLEAPIGEDPDKRDYIVSNAKIEASGFQPRYSLDFGINELIKGYQMIRDRRYGNA